MEQLWFMVLLLGLGYLSQRLPAFPENTSMVLNQFVIYLSFPATVLLKINGLNIQPNLLVLALVPWILVLVSIVLVHVLAKRLHWSGPMKGAVLLSMALGNTSFFGFPAVSAFFGADALGYAIIYDQLGSFLTLATFGTVVVSLYGKGQAMSVRTVLGKIFGFPPFIALLIGFVLIDASFPSLVHTILESLSNTLVPLVIFSVGSQMKFNQPVSNLGPLAMIISFKMIVSPVIAFFILLLLGVKDDILNICVFEAGMPTMVMAGVLASPQTFRPGNNLR